MLVHAQLFSGNGTMASVLVVGIPKRYGASRIIVDYSYYDHK